MAKLKLKLEEPIFLEMDGTPEELANFVKILREQKNTGNPVELKKEVLEENKALVDKEKSELSSAVIEAQLRPITTEASAPVVEIPTVEDVVTYITSKKDCEHHTKELQEKYLGAVVKSRSNPVLYGAFDRVLRSARDIIAKQYGRTWDASETRNLGGRTNVTVYKLIKLNEESEIPQKDDPFQALRSTKFVPLNEFRRKTEPNMYQ